jgi:hypothetical protein
MACYYKAKEYEKDSLWTLAALEWEALDRPRDAKSCRLIGQSIERGDELRNATLGIHMRLLANQMTYGEYYKQYQEIRSQIYR